jgi:quinolinate synthase
MNQIISSEISAELSADTALVRKYLDRAVRPAVLDEETQKTYKADIKQLMQQKNARLVAHYYTDAVLQDLAEESGGFVGDSLEMARFGRDCDAEILIVAGVKFMGESARILSPEKTVLMPTLEATCSLDIGCPADEFSAFCDQHPDRTVVTSSIALDVVEHLMDEGKKIIWAPDKHLGSYIQKATGADMLLWDAACIVHEEFKARGLADMRKLYPNAAILAHPESPSAILEIADVVGSTTQIINAAKLSEKSEIIVATDQGIFHRLQRVAPEKTFIIAPTAGSDATCRSCAQCPWMGMNSLESLYGSLLTTGNEIHVDSALAAQAMIPLQRMLDFAANNQLKVRGKA